MKRIKWILAVALGVLLGLCSSCRQRAKPEEPKQPPTIEEEKKTQEEEDKKPEKPKKEENLPIRKPILE